MKKIFLTICFGFIYSNSVLNKRQRTALAVNEYLENVNFKVDIEMHPKSNSPRDFEDTKDAIEAELNENAYNEIQNNQIKPWIII